MIYNTQIWSSIFFETSFSAKIQYGKSFEKTQAVSIKHHLQQMDSLIASFQGWQKLFVKIDP